MGGDVRPAVADPGHRRPAGAVLPDASYRPRPWADPVVGQAQLASSGRRSAPALTRPSRSPARSSPSTARLLSSGSRSTTARPGQAPGRTCGCWGSPTTGGARPSRSGRSHRTGRTGTEPWSAARVDRRAPAKSVAVPRAVGLGPGVIRALHADEIPIDDELVRSLVGRAMPAYADAPVRRLTASGSTNALFRLGDGLLVRLPRQPGGSADDLEGGHVAAGAGATAARLRARRGGRVRPDHGLSGALVSGPLDRRRAPGGGRPGYTCRPTTREPGGAPRRGWTPCGRQMYPSSPHLQSYRGSHSRRWTATRENIERCRALEGFDFDLDAAEQIWAEAMRLPGVADRAEPRWYHGDLAAENLLVRDGRCPRSWTSAVCRSATRPSTSWWPGRFLIPPPGRCSGGGSASTTRPGCAAGPGRSPSR